MEWTMLGVDPAEKQSSPHNSQNKQTELAIGRPTTLAVEPMTIGVNVLLSGDRELIGISKAGRSQTRWQVLAGCLVQLYVNF